MREFGKTGLIINKIGFGGIPIQRTDQEGANKLVAHMIQKGINFVDTARAYGPSEELLGNAMEVTGAKFYIASKSMSRTYESMKKDIDDSLKALKVEKIHLYQIHNAPLGEMEIIMGQDGAYKALLEAKAQGKIENIGITTHTLECFDKILEYGVNYFASVQFPFNIVESQGLEKLKKAHQIGMGTIIMKPLAGGAIENPNLAIKYIMSHDFVGVVIPGMADLEEVDINVEAANEVLLVKQYEFTKKELEEIQAIREELQGNFCRRCGYCLPCPQGINIPVVFLSGRYMERYGLADWGLARYMTSGLDENPCVRCGACLKKCPYDLPIPDMLDKVKLIKDNILKGE